MYSSRIATGVLLYSILTIAYAGECQNAISSNLIDETIALSETKTKSVAPWPFLQLSTRCPYSNDWNIATIVGLKEAGDDPLYEIRDPYVSDAHVTISNATYKFDFGRFRNNMSFNSVFGFAVPMGVIPAIQLDEASHIQTAQGDVDLLRMTLTHAGLGSVYVTGYRSDKLFKQKTSYDNSYNVGAIKPLGQHANIELQYDNESLDNSDVRQERLSLFFNIAGSFTERTRWRVAAESNRFKNKQFTVNNDNTTQNYYTELSQKDLLPAVDAYILAGGSNDVKDQVGGELGIFLNLSDMLHLTKSISILAGAARARTRFEDGVTISTNRYSVQINYKM